MRIDQVQIDHPDAQRLIAEVQQVYVAIYGSPDETPLEDGYFEPPHGGFFVGYLDSTPVACGAYRFRPEIADELGYQRPAEVKRMFVVPGRQRQGLARRMLIHLEASALAEGATAMILETGAPQRSAIALYRSAGYEPIAPFGHYRDSPLVRCFARPL